MNCLWLCVSMQTLIYAKQGKIEKCFGVNSYFTATAITSPKKKTKSDRKWIYIECCCNQAATLQKNNRETMTIPQHLSIGRTRYACGHKLNDFVCGFTKTNGAWANANCAHGNRPLIHKNKKKNHTHSFINVCINNVLLCVCVCLSTVGLCFVWCHGRKNNHDERWRLITIVLLENIWGEKLNI